jgi:hypothetical protein
MSPRRRALAWVAVLAGIGVMVLVVRGPSGDGTPLDPGGTGRLGAKALVVLLAEGGADVRVSARPPTADRRTAIVLNDTFDQERSDAIEAWVRGGGTLVVTDPTSLLTQVEPAMVPFGGASDADELRSGCSGIPALAGISTISAGGSLVYERAGRAQGAVGCFSTREGDWLVATPLGKGTVVALGGSSPFVNANLAKRDAAGLAVALLAPRPGSTTQVISDLAPDSGDLPVGQRTQDDGGLFSGLPGGARVAGIQLLVVFLGVALWRGRRLGRPVVEDPPVEVPGSELVVAVGHLYQKGRHRQRAARVMAERARRAVADRVGLPRGTDARTVAEVASARTGMPAQEIWATIAPPDPPDDEALLALARATDDLATRLSAPPAPKQEKP